MPSPASRALLQTHAPFLREGKSINVGSSDGDGQPSLVRALGARVSSEAGSLTLYLHRPQATRLLADIARHGRISAVFSDPPTHRTLQLKGGDAREVPTAPEDVVRALEYIESFSQVLAPLGFTAEFVRTVQTFEPEDLVTVTFSPTESFDQTPGPHAGQRLEGALP
jgi:hypothetical protein